eukprot:1043568-Rhodomonas_salina.2
MLIREAFRAVQTVTMFQLVKLFASPTGKQRLDAYWLHPTKDTSPDYDPVQAEEPWGDLYHPAFGSNGNCDGGRSHTYCDYSSHYMKDFKPF